MLDELTTGLDPQARRDTWALIEEIRERGVTIVLVTHFMEEAERLADRVALIDQGRVVAVDTPTGLTVSASPEQVIRFRPSLPLPDGLLDRVPGVTSVRVERDQLVVSGTGDVLAAVISELARNGIVANQLRVEQANLEDAFVALTNHDTKEDRNVILTQAVDARGALRRRPAKAWRRLLRTEAKLFFASRC